MICNYQELLEEFKNISNKLWIKGVNRYTNSADLTLESLLGKKVIACTFRIIKE